MLFISQKGISVYSDTKWKWQKHFCLTSESGDDLEALTGLRLMGLIILD